MNHELSIPTTNGITILVWSMPSAVVIGLLTPFRLPKRRHNLPFVKRAILWDAPSNGFGFPPTPTGFSSVWKLSLIMFLHFVSTLKNTWFPALPTSQPQAFPFQGSILQDPGYAAWAENAVDLRSVEGNSRATISHDPTRESHRYCAESTVTKQILYGTRALPENLEGSWISRDWILEGGWECKVCFCKLG
jgi:hypothetical protein